MNGEEGYKIESSDDMIELRPQTKREYLMIMFEAQKTMLKRQEEFNGFRRECEARLGRLEGSVGGVILALVMALAGLALKVLFGA